METSHKKEDYGDASEMSVNPGYALGQLASAFNTNQTHPDAEIRHRAAKKITDWVKVFEGILSGTLSIGSRTPIKDAPAWATPEVARGGFATGRLLAARALHPQEKELIKRIRAPKGISPRAALNSYYLSDAGIAELQQMLETGCYRVEIPEDGALLTVAWLLQQGDTEAAQGILNAIGPLFDRLRFYPIPTERPLTDSSLVYLQTVEQTIQSLNAIRVPEDIQTQQETLQIWNPLCDRTVALFQETVEGAVPSLQTDGEGKPLRTATGQYQVEGGWPCQQYPSDWKTRARALLTEYRDQRNTHRLSGKPERRRENFAVLRGYLETCIRDPQQLTGSDVGKIRLILAQINAKRGLPGSKRCQQLREQQSYVADIPTTKTLSKVIMARLARFPFEEGLESTDEVLAPVSGGEAEKHHVPVGQPLRERFEKKVRRAVMASVETLVEQKIIPSGETLALVIPQITAQVSASGITDMNLRRLYSAVYRAFRRRRSLLLLHFQSQVRLMELPWVAALVAYRGKNRTTQATARQTLERVVVLALTSFPQQILPNKLLQEIRALVQDAELKIPIVEEVAVDIFMGSFTEKFLLAAQVAAELLRGTLYEHYYDISYASVQQIHRVKPPQVGRVSTSSVFDQLCKDRAGKDNGGSWVAKNGKIIEQEQILTTHNLAALFVALGLTETLRSELMKMSQHCFRWICQRQQQVIPEWQTRLQMVKNTAYAWRQMLFFLSLLPEDNAHEFFGWASAHLGEQTPEFQIRFEPAMNGLIRAVNGLPAENRAAIPPARRFLGWTTETHWLLPNSG